MATSNISRIIRQHAERRPEKEALVHGDRRISYRELDRQVDELAAGLLDLGVEEGDIVPVLMMNRPEYIVAVFALARMGAILLPVNWRLAADEMSYILEHSGAKAVIAEPAFHTVVLESLERVPAVETRISLCEEDEAPDGWRTYAGVVARGQGRVIDDLDREDDDLHCVMYTSGTTSRPKGVMLTHGNVIWNSMCHGLELGFVEEDRTLLCVPLFHVSGLHAVSISALFPGGTLVFQDTFRGAEIMPLVDREGITALGYMAGQTFNDILAMEDLDAYDASGVRFLITAAVSWDSWTAWRKRFPHMHLSFGYGMTELCSGTGYSEAEIMDDREKFGSAGRCFPFMDLKVVDDDGNELPANEPGELIWRGPKAALGYWREPELTAETFRDGWVYSGDIGRVDADGHMYFMDRKKDMIKSGGENVASAEVERVLLEHEAIVDAAVVGVPDERWDEVPKAFLVAAPGASVTEQDVIDHCLGSLAKFKAPKHVAFVDELPRNDSGKVLKRVLRDREV